MKRNERYIKWDFVVQGAASVYCSGLGGIWRKRKG